MGRFMVLMAVLGAMLATTALAESPEVTAGRRIAQRSCGGCHAVGTGTSPLAEAPPFSQLHRRHRPGGLGELLREGMIAPIDIQEEGSMPVHPRMPQVELGPDEVFQLTAYLQSLSPAATPSGRMPVP